MSQSLALHAFPVWWFIAIVMSVFSYKWQRHTTNSPRPSLLLYLPPSLGGLMAECTCPVGTLCANYLDCFRVSPSTCPLYRVRSRYWTDNRKNKQINWKQKRIVITWVNNWLVFVQADINSAVCVETVNPGGWQPAILKISRKKSGI